jgi:hypothetical protein
MPVAGQDDPDEIVVALDLSIGGDGSDALVLQGLRSYLERTGQMMPAACYLAGYRAREAEQ